MLERGKMDRHVIEIVGIDSLVPEEHLLRKIDKAVDFSRLYEMVEPLYCEDNGRPSVDPVVLFKMVLIQHLYGLPSLRRTAEEVSGSIYYRWFLGYTLQEETPHFSTVSYNFRHRFTEETVDQVFRWILEEVAEAGYVTWNPCGVVGEILPWNGPFLMGCQKVNAILAAGNTVVIKPPTWGVLSMLLMASVYEEAGFPAGVVNVVTGSGPEVGNYLVESDQVDMVSMTGGTATGREIIAHSAKLVKDIALELGGKSPNIFFEDVDIQQAARFAVYGFTNHAGQICVSGTRILVQRNIYDRFLEAMVAAAGRLVPGDGFDPNANLNTLISKAHAATVWDYIESGKREGARLLCGGVPYTEGPLAQGNFVPVTIFADVTPNMTIFQEEIFGPVGCVTPFDTEEEAIALANGTAYGLAGGVFTKDIKRAIRVADKVKSGQIYVNNYFSKGMIESPGTGWKESGLGIAGIHKYMISKTVFLETIDDVLPPV